MSAATAKVMDRGSFTGQNAFGPHESDSLAASARSVIGHEGGPAHTTVTDERALMS